MKINKINIEKIEFFLLELYLIAITAFQLRTGIDRYVLIGSFIFFFLFTLLTERKVKIYNILKWGLIFWLYYFVSITWAKNPNDTLEYLLTAIQIISIYFLVPTISKDESKVNTILKLIVIATFYSSIIILLRTPKNLIFSTRLGESIGIGPNMIGMRVAFSELIALYLYHKNKNKKNILFIVFFTLLSLLTGSKKALVIICLGTFLFEILIANKKELIFKAITYMALGLIIIVCCLKINFLYNIIGNRIESLYATVIIGEESNEKKDLSYIERKFYMEEAMALFKEHQLLGYGGNNFVTKMREIEYWHIAYSHNNYTELLCTLGIVGFIIYYFYFIVLLKKITAIYLKNTKNSLAILLMIILWLILLLDYSNVTYIQRFNVIVISIIESYCYLKNDKLKRKGLVIKW